MPKKVRGYSHVGGVDGYHQNFTVNSALTGNINNATYTYGSGEIKVEVDNKIWEVLLDFTSGYHRFELNKALALPTTYSLQFYMAMSGQNKPRHMTIEQLKDWLLFRRTATKPTAKTA